eukprot:c43417_g1_i1 orf=842-2548(-)
MRLFWVWLVAMPVMALGLAATSRSSPAPAPHSAHKPDTPAPSATVSPAPAPSMAKHSSPSKSPAPSIAKHSSPSNAPAPSIAKHSSPSHAPAPISVPEASPSPKSAHSQLPAPSPAPEKNSSASPSPSAPLPSPRAPFSGPSLAPSPKISPPPSSLPHTSIPPVFPPAGETPPSVNTSGSLVPAQVAALQSLGVRLPSNPCAAAQNILLCDNGSPSKHLLALQLEYCSVDAVLTTSALAELTTLKALAFLDCPMLPVHVPLKLVASLTSFSCIASLGKTDDHPEAPGLPGTWLSKLNNLTEIIVTDVEVNTSALGGVLTGLKHLKQMRFSRTNITGVLPKTWPLNVTSVDLSDNELHGAIPAGIGKLRHLQEIDLSNNRLTGHIPNVFGKINKLQKIILGSNGLTGPIPASISSLSSLVYLDLGNNKLNGSIPESISGLSALRYLDLSNNDFTGPLPFNSSFIKTLNTLRVGGNSGICYDHKVIKSKFLTDVPACDSSGEPLLPTDNNSPASAPDVASAPGGQIKSKSTSHHHGRPKTIVSAVAISLGAIMVLIVLAVVVSRCRSRKY